MSKDCKLLKGKIGRVALPGGHEKNLLKSLRIISKLPQQTVIYPGHGDSSLSLINIS